MCQICVNETGAWCLAELAMQRREWDKKARNREKSRLRWQRLRQDPEWYARFKETSRQHMRTLRLRRRKFERGGHPPHAYQQ